MRIFVSTLICFILSSVCSYGQSDDTSTEKVQRLVRKNPSGVVLKTSSSGTPPVVQIPYQEEVSQTGAQTCEVPIPTSSVAKFVPKISLQYNSQRGNGIAGYGWEIGGLSSINITNKNPYYNDTFAAANVTDTSAVWSLDGNPLVRNVDSEFSDYQYKTARGQIYVKKVLSSGNVTYFMALYPDGSSAKFGYPGTSATALSYPIVMQSDGKGNSIEYTYLKRGNRYDISKIRYDTSRDGKTSATITFSYINRRDSVIQYYAGREISRGKILKRIESRGADSLLVAYGLEYNFEDNVNFLASINCQRYGVSPNKLSFGYGEIGEDEEEIEPNLVRYDSTTFTKGIVNSKKGLIYCRGKFDIGNFNDGLLMYPDFSNYVETDVTGGILDKHYVYESGFPADQIFLFVPFLHNYNMIPSEIVAEDGFQTIGAIDVDGDGADELVKVNFYGTQGENTNLKITVFNYENSSITSSTSIVSIKGIISDDDYDSPSKREYFFGDFMGTGKSQLLAMAYSENAFGKSQTSYAALIDLSNGTKISDRVIFDLDLEDTPNIIAFDIDNDGKTELCRVASGMEVYISNSNGYFSKKRIVSGINKSLTSSKTQPPFYADMNGDGYLDIIIPPEENSSAKKTDSWEILSYSGSSFVKSSMTAFSRKKGDKFFFMDVNRDGLADLIRIRDGAIETMLNINGKIDSSKSYTSPTTLDDDTDVVPCNIANYRSMSSFIAVHNLSVILFNFTIDSSKKRAMSSLEDSFGNVNEYYYTNTVSDQNNALRRYYTETSFSPTVSQGFIKSTFPLNLVGRSSKYLPDNSSQPQSQKTYDYYNAVLNTRGLGFCGFSKLKIFDKITTFTTINYFNPEKFGVLDSTIVSLSDDARGAFQKVTNTWDSNSTKYGKLDPRLTKSVQVDSLSGITTTTSYKYDSYNFPITVGTSRSNELGDSKGETTEISYKHSVTPSRYILGNPSAKIKTRTKSGLKIKGDVLETILSAKGTWQKKEERDYDTSYRPISVREYAWQYMIIVTKKRPVITPTQKSIVDSLSPLLPLYEFIIDTTTNIGGGLLSREDYAYDDYGNISSKISYSHEANSGLTTSYTYDSNGRYLVTSTDPLGHTTTYSEYNAYGNPAKVTDFRNRTTSYSYDTWGNLTKTSYPDGSWESKETKWGGVGLYCVTETSSTEPSKVTHYDAANHVLRTGIQLFDGHWQYTDRKYNDTWALINVSLPFKESERTTAGWNKYYYDKYKRNTGIDYASGKQSKITYNKSITTTEENGITTSKTVNADGYLIKVTDPGGDIEYEITHPDGNPDKVTVHGNVVTTFEYDAWRDRCSITDPSFGTQIDTMVWNADGSTLLTQKNQYGTVVTKSDMYGRILSVYRTLADGTADLSTNFHYSSYGLLSNVIDDNGTIMAYSYDAYDRPLYLLKVIDNNGMLQRKFSYTSDGRISSVEYNRSGKVIATEHYGYAFGYKSSIKLADSTIVWQLNSVNSYGNPTSATTGSMRRSYAYDTYGIPTSRTFGEMVNSYSFDAKTGNLLSREDESNGSSESFGYDSLNRLSSVTQGPLTGKNTFDGYANATTIGYAAEMTYADSDHPYNLTDWIPDDDTFLRDRTLAITYAASGKPRTIYETGVKATISYAGDDERIKMVIDSSGTTILTRLYIDGCYDEDINASGTKTQRLYLGGGYYDAPMVYVKEGDGDWTLHNIGRDYLGSILYVADVAGNIEYTYGYDAWGRSRDVEDLEPLTREKTPRYFLGRGYTGHEYLPWFALYNANARLYDPLLGRFLSPDPYVQAPDFTQNFNRFAYCLNNPLKYTDESGEWAGIDDLVAIFGGGLINWLANGAKFNMNGLEYFIAGAISGEISLYASPMVAAAVAGLTNSIVRNAFDSNGYFNSINNINGRKIVSDTVLEATMSFVKLPKFIKRDNFFTNLLENVSNNALRGGLREGVREYSESQDVKTSLNEAKKGLYFGAANGLISFSASYLQKELVLTKSHYSILKYTNENGDIIRISYTSMDPFVASKNIMNKYPDLYNSKLSIEYLSGSLMDAKIRSQILLNASFSNQRNYIAPRYWSKYGIKP